MTCLNRWGKIFRTLLVRGGGEEEAVPGCRTYSKNGCSNRYVWKESFNCYKSSSICLTDDCCCCCCCLCSWILFGHQTVFSIDRMNIYTSQSNSITQSLKAGWESSLEKTHKEDQLKGASHTDQEPWPWKTSKDRPWELETQFCNCQMGPQPWCKVKVDHVEGPRHFGFSYLGLGF